MRILLIEDDPVLQAVTLRSLTDAGHRVDVASHLEEARHFWRVQVFDVVLLDLNLPLTAHAHAGEGSGLTLLREVRARGDKTPVLVLTARNRTDERIAGLDAGADDYLGKPFDLARLRRACGPWCDGHMARRTRSRWAICHCNARIAGFIYRARSWSCLRASLRCCQS